MNVWLTRSEPGASRHAAELEAAGYRCLVAPVLDVEPVAGDPPQGDFDLLVFLSEHAVRHGLVRIRPGSARVLAVGGRTALMLAEAGCPALHPDRADSEGLLGMPDLVDIMGRRVLLVCGEGGRGFLATELVRRGAAVERFVCYRRRLRPVIDADLGAIDAIVAGSAESLRRIAEVWFAAGGEPGIALLVPSARVAERGVALGFRNVHDCRGADVAAVLRGLAELSRTGTA